MMLRAGQQVMSTVNVNRRNNRTGKYKCGSKLAGTSVTHFS